MTDIDTDERMDRRDGPFPEPQPGPHPWESWEAEHGPFERRGSYERRALALASEEDTDVSSTGEAGDRRRRRGRRKADVLSTDARATLTDRSRKFVQRFREPIIGLTLAGVAAPLINAGVNPATEGPTTKKATDVSREAVDTDRNLEEEVGAYWAEAEEGAVQEQTVEGAVTRWSIDEDLATKIYEHAARHDIEPDVAYGLVFTESTFRNRAVSHVGARGLTQLMPRTAQWLDPGVSLSDLYNPDVNLDLGFRYLRQLIDKYDGDVEKALTAYNRGPGTVDRILKRGGNPDNGYAGKVLAG